MADPIDDFCDYTADYTPKRGAIGYLDLPNPPVLRRAEPAEPFHIGQSYEKAAARQVACAQCGSVEFHVGMGSWYTAIRCKNCRWEACIHNG